MAWNEFAVQAADRLQTRPRALACAMASVRLWWSMSRLAEVWVWPWGAVWAYSLEMALASLSV